MRNDKIIEYHEILFEELERFRTKHKKFMYRMREKNNGGKLEKGWLFRGSGHYITFS